MPRRPIYYGWANLGVAALAMVATLPGRTQGLGLVTEPLIRDLGIDRVSYASVNLWATLLGAILCLPCGRLLDRFGSRVVLTSVLLGLGTTVLFMSAARGLPEPNTIVRRPWWRRHRVQSPISARMASRGLVAVRASPTLVKER